MPAQSRLSDVCGARVLGAGKAVSPRGWLLPRRVLDEDVLLYVQRGAGEIALGDATHPVRRDHLYVLKRGVPHLIRAGSRHAIEYWTLEFALLDAQGNAVDLGALGLPDVVPMGGRRSLERLFLDCVQHALHRRRGGRLALLASLFALLDGLACDERGEPPGEGVVPEANGDGAARVRHSDQVMAAVALMMQQVTGDVNLEELAAHAGMSPSHFEKVFKRAMGSSPHAYYTGLKMERAKQQMAAGEGTLTEVAQGLGFASLHHFSRTFKRYEGELPSCYARRARRA